MRKLIKTDSLVTRSVILLVVCSLAFMLVALPVSVRMTYKIFYPYMVEYITQETGDSAAAMSRFLGYSNPSMYWRTYPDAFRGDIQSLRRGEISRGQFIERMEDKFDPFEINIDFSEDFSYSCTCYPAVYIEGEGMFSGSWNSAAAEAVMNSQWFEDYREELFERRLYSPEVAAEDGIHYIGYVYGYYADEAQTMPYYSILMLPTNQLLGLWQSIVDLGIEDFAFIGQDYNILYAHSNNSTLDLDWIRNELTSDRQHHVVKKQSENETMYSVLVSYESEGLRFVMSVPGSVFFNMFKSNIAFIQLTNLALLALLVVLILLMLNGIFRRLRKLSRNMEAVELGDYSVRSDDTGNDEIGRLAAVFNDMTQRIETDVNRQVENEKREKQLQYNLMVSAIDPHFINNTLNTSTRLAEMGRNEDVVVVNDALINFLRDNLRMKGYKSYDTVENELKALEQYITIQNYLCDNTISLKYDVSPENMALQIPKFLIQPLVENSILHGIVMNMDENGNMIPGVIEISLRKQDGHISVTIRDNGIGMDEETVKEYFCNDSGADADGTGRTEHIGVMNIRSRLDYLYGDNYTLSVDSSPGHGTAITIVIPIG